MKYQVKRRINIEADLSDIISLIEDFTQWHKWSPWTIIEPDCHLTYSGKPGEASHSMSWDGDIIGSGTNTLMGKTEDRIYYDLKFIKPFKSKAKASFLFEKQDGSIKVTWVLDSSMPFFLFFMVKSMKNWIGMDYDRGLRMLKEVLEKGGIHAKTSFKGKSHLDGFNYIGIQKSVPFSEIGPEMAKDFDTLHTQVVEKSTNPPKNWICVYPKMDMKTMMMTYIAAVSDENIGDIELSQDFVRGFIKKGPALEVTHDGSYEFLGNAWSMGMMHQRAKKLKSSDFPFEQYWNDPKESSAAKLKTSVFFPIK